jgi:hypothetical protein
VKDFQYKKTGPELSTEAWSWVCGGSLLLIYLCVCLNFSFCFEIQSWYLAQADLELIFLLHLPETEITDMSNQT